MTDHTTDAGSTHDPDDQRVFLADVAAQLGRALTDDESRLAASLIDDKSAAVVARELAGAPIADPRRSGPNTRTPRPNDAGPSAVDRSMARRTA